jgi:hypothetical protein
MTCGPRSGGWPSRPVGAPQPIRSAARTSAKRVQKWTAAVALAVGRPLRSTDNRSFYAGAVPRFQVVSWVPASATCRRHSCAGAAGAAAAVLRLTAAGWWVSGFPGWRVSGFPLASRMVGVWLPLASTTDGSRMVGVGWWVSGFHLASTFGGGNCE